LIPFTFPVVMWMVYLISLSLNLDLSRMGILPRDMIGILGIISGPIVHANFSHLLSNTIPLLILGWTIFFFYSKVSYKSFIVIYVLTGLFVWLFAREVYHIGASGIVYGFVSFLFFSGIFRRDNKSIAIALIVTFLYGGIIWGVLPGQKGISWESHLFGGIAGIITAFIFRKIDPQKKYDWEDEEDDFDVDELEVSYDPEKNKFNI
ncbi:MAG: rhomboid family intramembrane serine protease, partial [Candidatus Neomarinimicrobiota bacterium]